MSGVVFLPLQSPTVRIPCVAVGPDGTDTLHVTFKRYSTDIAGDKMKAFHDARAVKLAPYKTMSDIDAAQINQLELDDINEEIAEANKQMQKDAEAELATILFNEIVDIEGLQDADKNPVSYKDASDEDKAAIYRMLNHSNPYVLALIDGYSKALVNVGEARAKN